MGRRRDHLPPEVAERLGPFYVYLLIDRRNGEPFYVGKGTGARLLQHGHLADITHPEKREPEKLARFREIRQGGQEPRIDVVRHALNEKEALLVEAALIDCLGPLTNVVRGHGSELGRTSLKELVSIYGATQLEARSPPAILIRLARWKDHREEMEPGYYRTGYGWQPGMSEEELYDAVRGWWKLRPASLERLNINHFVAVANGVTRAVYEIDERIGPRISPDGSRRWAFKGRRLTHGLIWDAYVGSLGRRVSLSDRSAFRYWPPVRIAGTD